MNSFVRRGIRACGVAAFAAGLSGAASALCGQSATSAQPRPAGSGQPQQMDRVVVTGSYLPRSAEVDASPLVTVDAAEMQQAGATDALRLLKTLTLVFSGSGNIGNEVNLQGFGESYLALRNLPTLVLLDGRRLPNSPISSNNSSATIPAVDLNTIPLSMIERIEVLKDSASTLYGSDAVGGVVNIVRKRNYQGVEFGGRYGTDRDGDYTTREAWVTGGVARTGWSVSLGAQYFKNSKLLSTERRIAALEPAELIALGQNPAVLAAHVSPTFAGRVGNFVIAGSPLAVGAAGYNASIRSLPPKSSPATPPRTLEQLAAAGYYIPISSTPLSQAVAGTTSILNTALYGFAIVLPTERRQAFASAAKEIFGKRLEVFADYLFSETVNGGTDLAPAPVPGVAPLTLPAVNPFNLFGVNIGAGGPPNAPGVRTRLDEIGPRFSDTVVETHRVVAGLRGEVNERWNWETAFNYGAADAEQTFFGAANGMILQQALVPQIVGGNYVYDSQGRPLSIYVHNGRNVPVYDVFGIPGVNAPETLEALRTTLHRSASVEQRSFDARVTGRLFELPAGELSVAFGGEIRREEISSAADALFNAGLAVGYIPVNNLPKGERRTRALFLETRVPLAAPKNAVPFMREAELTAAIRHERIKPGGDASTPKFGVRWLPVDESLVVRGTFARGFVAPSIFALYGPPQGTSSPTIALPEGNGQTGPGGATGRIVSGQFFSQVLELSNPTLGPAKSESWTAGIVFSPKQIKGLHLSADYYRIEQDKVGGFDYTFIVGDLNARGAASRYAADFRFADGTPLTSSASNQVTSTNVGTLRSVYQPLGDLRTDGLDLAARYSFAPTRVGNFSVGADTNILFNFRARANPSSPYLQYARNFTEALNGKGNPQGVLPGYAVRAHVGHTLGNLRSQLRWSYIPSVTAAGSAFGENPGTPNIFRANLQPYTIPSYDTVDLAATYNIPNHGRRWAKNVSITASVNNLLGEDSPFVPGAGSGVGSESNTVKSTYDIIGRFFFIELRKGF